MRDIYSALIYNVTIKDGIIVIDCFAEGRKIKELRLKSTMNQDEIANIVVVSRQAVSRWEIGL